ncbi:unnamed protein product [Gordionus sp. m RMFG-2023]|uniref:putative uncharacterized protein DDB_G0282133 n=1 Tax=Gordionus sp. m RMFG-2023 TaxID=3053472 RepID=UPI0030E155EA
MITQDETQVHNYDDKSILSSHTSYSKILPQPSLIYISSLTNQSLNSNNKFMGHPKLDLIPQISLLDKQYKNLIKNGVKKGRAKLVKIDNALNGNIQDKASITSHILKALDNKKSSYILLKTNLPNSYKLPNVNLPIFPAIKQKCNNLTNLNNLNSSILNVINSNLVLANSNSSIKSVSGSINSNFKTHIAATNKFDKNRPLPIYITYLPNSLQSQKGSCSPLILSHNTPVSGHDFPSINLNVPKKSKICKKYIAIKSKKNGTGAKSNITLSNFNVLDQTSKYSYSSSFATSQINEVFLKSCNNTIPDHTQKTQNIKSTTNRFEKDLLYQILKNNILEDCELEKLKSQHNLALDLCSRYRSYQNITHKAEYFNTKNTILPEDGFVEQLQNQFHNFNLNCQPRPCIYQYNSNKKLVNTHCLKPALPYSNLCSNHIAVHPNQQLFERCSAKFSNNIQCSNPTFDLLNDVPLCWQHARKKALHDITLLKSAKKSASTKGSTARFGQISKHRLHSMYNTFFTDNNIVTTIDYPKKGPLEFTYDYEHSLLSDKGRKRKFKSDSKVLESNVELPSGTSCDVNNFIKSVLPHNFSYPPLSTNVGLDSSKSEFFLNDLSKNKFSFPSRSTIAKTTEKDNADYKPDVNIYTSNFNSILSVLNSNLNTLMNLNNLNNIGHDNHNSSINNSHFANYNNIDNSKSKSLNSYANCLNFNYSNNNNLGNHPPNNSGFLKPYPTLVSVNDPFLNNSSNLGSLNFTKKNQLNSHSYLLESLKKPFIRTLSQPTLDSDPYLIPSFSNPIVQNSLISNNINNNGLLNNESFNSLDGNLGASYSSYSSHSLNDILFNFGSDVILDKSYEEGCAMLDDPVKDINKFPDDNFSDMFHSRNLTPTTNYNMNHSNHTLINNLDTTKSFVITSPTSMISSFDNNHIDGINIGNVKNLFNTHPSIFLSPTLSLTKDEFPFSKLNLLGKDEDYIMEQALADISKDLSAFVPDETETEIIKQIQANLMKDFQN